MKSHGSMEGYQEVVIIISFVFYILMFFKASLNTEVVQNDSCERNKMRQKAKLPVRNMKNYIILISLTPTVQGHWNKSNANVNTFANHISL